MFSGTITRLELPLESDVWGLLQDEAARSGQAPVSLASHILASWARERHRQRVAQEIAEFAAAQAGSELDLDEDLEFAALQALGEAAP